MFRVFLEWDQSMSFPILYAKVRELAATAQEMGGRSAPSCGSGNWGKMEILACEVRYER